MPKFLSQPDPIYGYEFNPIPIDIHLGVIKIPTEEIMHDDAINNTEAIIVGTDRKEVINRNKLHSLENSKDTVNTRNRI